MSAVDFDVLKLIPKMLEEMQDLKKEVTELRQHIKPKYDLTKRDDVKKFLNNITDTTLCNMMKDGRLKENIHYKKEIKGKRIMITFVEDGILAYKKGLK
ncbi:hypothetical protein N5T79_06370 [Aliarcobacter cryaerophilus]|uniref:hypothetical protein n=1 Tax=Aliarcobacter cryaerophilus TaxID=28198 RepID=UPI0021B6BD31|nr:hypothetical protein [Aliarcobacter cryaerophilus]MCT7528766.1 hypothetical protein [Aliarcobacter cryaerophilus]